MTAICESSHSRFISPSGMSQPIERQLFDQNLAAQLVVHPSDGVIRDANRAAEDFYGVPAGGLIGTSVVSLSTLPGEDTLQLLEIAADIGAHAYAIPHRHASGEVRLVELYAGPLTAGDAKLAHLIVHDVTERVRAEDEARELHAERVAAQRTASLQEELRRQETLSRMGELVAGVAHEVRTPLFAITSTLDALRARAGSNPELEKYFPVLSQQVDRLNALMTDLLEYGKPAALELRRISVGQLIEGVGELTRAAADSARVHLELAPDPHGEVHGDRRRLLQVLQNLVSNAIQHSPPESTVHVDSAYLTSEAGDVVELRVIDAGAGFAPGDLPHLFEPFFSRRAGGTGLGLAIAHRLVHDHGGTIDASNRDGGGACVTVRLPALPDPETHTNHGMHVR